jgi:alpha-1,2-mannosyltransferase
MLSDLIGTVPLLLASLLAFTRLHVWSKGRSEKKIITFFHPYAAGRGGGERVLWAAIDGILGSADPNNTRVIIYSVDDDRESMMRKRNATFGFSAHENDKIVEIKKIFFASLLEPKTWPIATIIGQSIGSVIVLLVALMRSSFSDWPTTFIDTTGCPFTLPVAKLLTGAKPVRISTIRQ